MCLGTSAPEASPQFSNARPSLCPLLEAAGPCFTASSAGSAPTATAPASDCDGDDAALDGLETACFSHRPAASEIRWTSCCFIVCHSANGFLSCATSSKLWF